MSEIILSRENIAPLEELKKSLSHEAQQILEWIRLSVNDTLNKAYGATDFQSFIKLIDSIFDTTPTRFINGLVENEAGQNLWSLKVLTIALMLWLDTFEALRLFGEHYESVQKNPEWNNHTNIRNLDIFGIEAVKIYGVPFSAK